jgi:hypothetical protein
MPEQIAVILETPRVQVQPGGKASANLTIRNRSEEVGNYLLVIEGAPADWADVSPNQLSVFPFQEARAQINLHLPANVQAALYRVTVLVRSQERADLESRSQLEIDVPAAVVAAVQTPQVVVPPPQDPGVQRQAPPRTQTASQIELRVEALTDKPLPPPAAQWKLRLKNAGTVLDTFGFGFAGIPQAWISIDPVELQLYPGEEGSATLVVTPPGDAKAAPYPFIARAYSHVNINERTEVPLKIEVHANAAFSMEITPKEAETQGMRDFQVVFTSSPNANSDLILDLVASDQDGACDYAFNPKELLLPARQRAASNVRVRPRAVLAPNERKQYTIKIEGIPRQDAAPRQAIEARLTQTAASPVSLAIQPQVLQSELEADYILNITNPSALEVNLFFSAEDPEMACDYTFLPDRRNVPANGTSSTRLHIRARAAHRGEAPKQILFVVKATRQGELVACASAQGGLSQLPGRPITLELIPPQQSQPAQAKYSLRVNNPFAVPIQVWLDARDENDALEFKFANQSMVITPGVSGTVEMTARPKDKLLPADQRRVHKFAVSALVQGISVPTLINGTLAQTRGFDWGGPLGKFFSFIANAFKLIWKFILWLIPWIIVLIVLIFLADLVIAGLFHLVNTDAQIGPIITGVIPSDTVHWLHDTMLFKTISDSIVEAVFRILSVVQQRMTPPPPTPTPLP